MGLSCDCDTEGHFWSRTRTARQRHTCFECDNPIEPGEDYEFLTYAEDGNLSNYKVCERCNDLGESFMALGFCWTFGELLEMHRDYLEVYTPPVMAHYSRR